MSRWLLTLALVVVVVPAARADEVKTKDGKVYKNLTLKQETPTHYIFVDLDDKKLTIAKTNVETYDKKPTIRDEFNDKHKAADAKDTKALMAIARWAKEMGLNKEARTTFEEVAKVDPENAEAQGALGFVKKDGKWISRAEIEAKRNKEFADRYKAMNFVLQKDGSWLSPAEVSIRKLNLVQHGRFWVTKEIQKKIEEQGYANREGEWLSKEDQARFEKGERHYKGGWKLAIDLDELHQKWDDPWDFKGAFVEVQATLRYKKSAPAFTLAEEAVAAAVALSGWYPDVYGDTGLLLVKIGKGIEDYKVFGGAAKPDWAALRSSDDGVFYSPVGDKRRGCAFTYLHDEEFVKYWAARGAIEAYVGRFTDVTKLDAKLLDAYASYFPGFKGEKYRPTFHQASYIFGSESNKPMASPSKFLENVSRKETATVARAGYFLAYLAAKNPEVFRECFQRFLSGGLNRDALRTAILGDMDAAAIDEDFNKWNLLFQKTYTPSDR